jgi:hypothetical protein
MLTIKHVTTLYEESVRLAYEVRVAREPKEGVDFKIPVVYADLVGVGTQRYDSGKVFVMNDAGSTVAKYDLGGWPDPEAEAA